MSDTTKIEWAMHTGGPFLGCSVVSCGCTHCYAKALAESRLEHVFRDAYKKAGFADWQTRPVWGDKATRVLSKGFWNDARRINAQHAKAGTRGRWFPSMIDWLDKMPGGIIDQEGNRLNSIAVLANFLKLIHDTPNLEMLLLTKRPENWCERLNEAWKCLKRRDDEEETLSLRKWISAWLDGDAPSNIWIGVSVENQAMADQRIVEIPAKVRFLSVEPMLEGINFEKHFWDKGFDRMWPKKQEERIHWAIFGGESGPGARACNVEWIRDGVMQCKAAGVAAFVKQLGARPFVNANVEECVLAGGDPRTFPTLKDKKGGDMSEWPDDLRVREFPKV